MRWIGGALVSVGLIAAVVAMGVSAYAAPKTLYIKMSSLGGSDSADCLSFATACASFNKAYQAASAGDTVLLCGNSASVCGSGAGSYPQQRMTAAPKGSGSQIIFQPAAGATAVVAKLDVGDNGTPIDRILFKNFTVKDPTISCVVGTPCAALTYLVSIQWTTNVDLDHVDVDGLYENVTAVGISGAAVGTDWTNSTIGKVRDAKVISIGAYNGASSAATDLRFDHMQIGDMVYNATTYAAQDIPHAECFYFVGPMDGFVVSNSKITECTSTGAMNWGGQDPMTRVHMFNNVWGRKYDYHNGVDVVPGSGVGYRGDSGGVVIDGDNNGGTGIFEYSVVDGTVVLDGWSSLLVRGVIWKNTGCTSGVDYADVMQTEASTPSNCNGQGTMYPNLTAFSSANFVNMAAGVNDWHPVSASSAQVDKGEMETCVSEDLDGGARPVGSACDLGPYEYGSSVSPVGDLNNDGSVNAADLTILLNNYTLTSPGWSNPAADINANGKVDVFDLSMLLRHYGQ